MTNPHPSLGASVDAQGVRFRVWAPNSQSADVVLFDGDGRESASIPMTADGNGFFEIHTGSARAGTLYKFRIDSGTFPDPVSRFQPAGVHGPSEVIDPTFAWSDEGWAGCAPGANIVYELHIGTFTPEGTWGAAARKLQRLADLGITIVEVMPVADFAGDHGWGYDGVDFFAPARVYGRPDDFRAFVDEAHRLGLAVILDVVYNHAGPDGCYLREFAKCYFHSESKNDWGDALNFDGEQSGPVRDFFLSNAGYWIREFHLDGLRLDATDQIRDTSEPHFLAELSRRTRAAAGTRRILLIAENERQDTRLVAPLDSGGFGLDAIWNDDFHHASIVSLTGRREAYFTDYRGTAQEFVSAAKHGFLYQGQYYAWQKKGRGTPTRGFAPTCFVHFLQNHDQIANSLRGKRLHEIADRAKLRALTSVLMFMPGTPMLFQGQECAADRPFLYFADHNPELARAVAKGREEFLSQFPSIAQPGVRDVIPSPEERDTFLQCKLSPDDFSAEPELVAFHRDVIALRKKDPVLADPTRENVDGAVLRDRTFLLRWFGDGNGDRLLLVNLDGQFTLEPECEPLLAPPPGRVWRQCWSSEAPEYGGEGSIPLAEERPWILTPYSAVLLTT